MTIPVLVLGASGMLGSMVVDVLARQPELAVTASVRSARLRTLCAERVDNANWVHCDLDELTDAGLAALVAEQRWVVNAIGITKPYVRDGNGPEIERAIRINSHFPYRLAAALARTDGRLLQIATDCVYSGQKGRYAESDPHDARDVYGKTKSLGEVYADNAHHLRASIVGPEAKAYAFLLEWLRRQPVAAKLKGFVNHRWNGVTTLHFAKVCRGVIANNLRLPHLQHLIPGDDVSKCELLRLFANVYGRGDIEIAAFEAQTVVDRTVATEQEQPNAALWRAAGHPVPPTIAEMVEELAAFNYRLGDLDSVG